MKILPTLIVSALFAFIALRLVRQERGAERGSERWLGLFFGALACGMPLRGAVAMGIGLGIDPGVANSIGQAMLTLSLASLAYFVWQLFRPADNWARWAFTSLSLLLALQLVLFITTGAHSAMASSFHLVSDSAMLMVFGWAFVESLRYWTMTRKRLGLGLVDPVVANRFLLWSLWTGAITMFPIFMVVVRGYILATGQMPETNSAAIDPRNEWTLQVSRVLMLLTGPTIAASTWLIFFPPARYLARIRQGATA